MALAQETLSIEAQAVTAVAQRLDGSFARAMQLVLDIPGRVVVMGMGKSGHIGRKIAATLASTGTPAMFVHPAEAIGPAMRRSSASSACASMARARAPRLTLRSDEGVGVELMDGAAGLGRVGSF